ncbi:MAG: restriction endonuclease subunit S [Crocinitomicaceae bacterium]
MIKEKKIRKEKALPIITEEFSKSIPSSWTAVRLGEVGDWGAGSTPLRSRPEFYGGKINWFKSGELNHGVMDYESEEKITDLALSKTSVKLNKPGDVLIAMYGATIGKTGVLAVHGTTNQAVCACTPFSCISSEYLHLLLKGLKQTFLNQGEGGAQPNISRVKIRSQIIFLPPSDEQEIIQKVVNQLFAEVEQLEDLTKERISLKEDFVTSALRRLTESDNTATEWNWLKDQFPTFFTEKSGVKKLRETILQLAVQGKLTAKWRALRLSKGETIEPASELLERIEAEKQQLIAEKKMRRDKPLPPIVEEDKTFELPSSWVWCRLMDITTLITDGKHGNCQDEPDSGYYFLSAKDVQKGKLLYDRARQINYKEFTEVHQRTALKSGDLCIVNTGATVGKTAIVQEDPKTEKSTFQKSVAVVKMLPQYVNVEYIESFIKAVTPNLLKTSGGSAINNLLLGDMRMLIVPFPSFEEQQAIVQKVNSLMTLCDELEQQIETSHTQIERLMQSCLKEVFEGDREVEKV